MISKSTIISVRRPIRVIVVINDMTVPVVSLRGVVSSWKEVILSKWSEYKTIHWIELSRPEGIDGTRAKN